jgi:hypothetical protein
MAAFVPSRMPNRPDVDDEQDLPTQVLSRYSATGLHCAAAVLHEVTGRSTLQEVPTFDARESVPSVDPLRDIPAVPVLAMPSTLLRVESKMPWHGQFFGDVLDVLRAGAQNNVSWGKRMSAVVRLLRYRTDAWRIRAGLPY